MSEIEFIEQKCNFKTERLQVCSWKSITRDKASEQIFEERVISILTPKVTESLPTGWQGIKTRPSAKKWIVERAHESVFLSVQHLSSSETVGFIFLYVLESEKTNYNLRFGYLLAESVWGKGLGTELVKGLVDWCENVGDINSISGGVERDNIGSIKVLEKVGFVPSTIDTSTENVLFYEYQFNK